MKWPRLRKAFLASAIIVTLLAGALAWLQGSSRVLPSVLLSEITPEFVPDIGIGASIFHMGGCADCHSYLDSSDAHFGSIAGGEGLETFAGTFYPPNITPDEETGIGSWTEAEFLNAMINGVSPEGFHYYPSFPYTSYANASIEDLLHLKAYLDTLPPVQKGPTDHELEFPFNIRFGNLIWKWLYHESQTFVPDSGKSMEWNRGAYIVNAIAHCGSCHTPRNLLYAEQDERRFSGAPAITPGGKTVPRIAGLDKDKILNGLDEWSGAVDENSSMYLVTLAFSRHVPFDEAEAVATYLSSLQSGQGP